MITIPSSSTLQNPVRWGVLFICSYVLYVFFSVWSTWSQPITSLDALDVPTETSLNFASIITVALSIVLFVSYLIFYMRLSSNNRILLGGKTVWSPTLILWTNIVGLVIGIVVIVIAGANLLQKVLFNEQPIGYMDVIKAMHWPAFINIVIALVLFFFVIGVLIDTRKTIVKAEGDYSKQIQRMTLGIKWVWGFYLFTCLLLVYLFGFDYLDTMQGFLQERFPWYGIIMYVLITPYLVVSLMGAITQSHVVAAYQKKLALEDANNQDDDDEGEPSPGTTPTSQMID